MNIERVLGRYKIKGKKEVDGMMGNERYCSIEESLKESLKQIKAIKNGDLAKKTWQDFCAEINEEKE